MTAFRSLRLLAAWKRIRGSPDPSEVTRVANGSGVQDLVTDLPTPAEAQGPEQAAEPVPSDFAEANGQESCDLNGWQSAFLAESTLPGLPESEPDSVDALTRPELLKTSHEYLSETELGAQALTDQAQFSPGAEDQPLEGALHLIDEYRRIELTALEARSLSNAALQAVQEVAQRLETLAEIRDLGRQTGNQLAVLSGLAEDITQRVDAIERQGGAIEERMGLFTQQKAAIENMTMELGRATTNQLAVLGGLVENLARRVDALQRVSGTIESRTVAFTEHKAESGKLTTGLGRLPKLEDLVGFLVGAVQEFRKRFQALAAFRPPLVDLPAATREDLTRRWRLLAANLRGAGGHFQRHRIALASVVGGLIVVAGVVIISTERGQVQRADQERQYPSLSSAAPEAMLSGSGSLDLVAKPLATPGDDSMTPAAEVQSQRDFFDEPVSAEEREGSPANDAASQGSSRPRFLGTLMANSNPPGADVHVDGRLVGRTPVQLARFRAGSHVVRMEREGYQRWTSAVHVTANQTTRITAQLEAERGP